jgi:hypothetical protein
VRAFRDRPCPVRDRDLGIRTDIPRAGRALLPDAALSTQDGVLMQYGVDDLAGALTLRTAQGRTVTFYISLRVRFDGHQVVCRTPPADGAPASGSCPDWPANVALGYSTAHSRDKGRNRDERRTVAVFDPADKLAGTD